MKQVTFTKGVKFESNTYYRAEVGRIDFYLSDTVRSYNPEYRSHTTGAGEYMDIAFLLCDLENVVLDFGGATLMFHGRIQPFMLDNCKNVTIKNLKLDYDRPFYTQASLISCEENTMRVRLDEGFSCRVDTEHKGLIATSETWENRMNAKDCLLWLYDPADKQLHTIILALFGDEIYPHENPPLPIRQIFVEQDGEDILFHGSFPADWVGRKDRKLVITHEPRDKTAIQTVGDENITLSDIVIVHGSALAFIGMHTKDIFIDRFDICANYDGNGRIVANNADGIHLFNCYGKVEIKNCTMEGLLDDTVNVHGNFVAVTEVLSDGIMSDSRLAGLTAALKLFLAGDRIAVYRGHTREKLAEFTLTDAQTDIESGRRVLRVAEPELLSVISEGDVIENLSANADVLIENCVFRRFRGTMRMQTSGKIVIKGCRFENRGTSLMMTGDTTYWYESGPVDDITIEDCYFAYALNWRIVTHTQVEYTEKAPYYHRGVKVKNCFFDGKFTCRLDHVDGIEFVGNKTSADELIISLNACNDCAVFDAREV